MRSRNSSNQYKGRKPIKLPDNYKELISKHFNSTIVNPYRPEQCRKDLKLTKSTLYNVLKKEKNDTFIDRKNTLWP